MRKSRTGTGVWILALEGEHDIATAAEIRTTLSEMAATGTGLVVDLSAVTFMDSSILHAIATGGEDRVAVVVPKEGIAARIADLWRLDALVPVYQSRVVACRECGPGGLLVR